MTDDSNSNKEPFSYRKARGIIRKLHVTNGDVVLIKHGTVLAEMDALQRLADSLGTMRIQAIIAVVEDFDDLTVLHEADMLKHGWIRTVKIGKMIKPKGLN